MQQGVPALDQNTPTSPNFEPGMTTPSIPMPDKSPATMMHLHSALQRRGINPASIAQLNNSNNSVTLPTQAIQDHNPQQPGVQIPASEAELIIKALSRRLEHRNKIEASVAKAIIPQEQEIQNA